MQPTSRKSPRRVFFFALYAVFLLAILEGFSFVAGRILQSKWGMYRDPVPADDGSVMPYEQYLTRRNPLLGWPREEEFGDTYAPDGSRWCLESGVPDDAPWAVSLYGDSFTADRVGGHTDHWGCRLERQLGANVRNYGVGGYGTDQALLRYVANEDDGARLVVLGHMAEDIMRNLTRYRDFQAYSQQWAFKPRFVIGDDDELELISIPSVSVEDYPRLLAQTTPQLVLEHELFHPNGPTGAVRLTFPFTLAVLRNLGFTELWNRVLRRPSYAPYYELDHPFQGAQITAGILRRFVATARERGQIPLIVLFPGSGDLAHFRETGRWYHQALIDQLEGADVEVIDFGTAVAAFLEGRPIEDAFGTGTDSKRTHYNQTVSHLVADTVLDRLRKLRLVEPAPVARADSLRP